MTSSVNPCGKGNGLMTVLHSFHVMINGKKSFSHSAAGGASTADSPITGSAGLSIQAG